MSKEHLEEVARRTGFIKRKPKLEADDFIRMLLYNELDNGTVSLNDHCCALQLNHGVDISKQAIDKKFSPESVAFIRELLEEQLGNQILQQIDIKILSHFTSVKTKDSVRWQLPANLKDFYPGSNGAASGAGLHAQFEYDLLSGKVSDLQIHNALYQDVTDAKQTVETVEKGSLILRDLGYYDKNVFKTIISKDAFFLSRLRPRSLVYELKEGKKVEVDLNDIFKKLKDNNLTFMEMEVFMSENDLTPVRLIIEPIPEEEFAKRMRIAGKEAKKKGRHLAKKYSSYARLGLYITNIPKEWVSLENIRTLYRLRWQIELRFKAFKSHCKLSKIKKMQIHRMECYLFATLLHIMLNWQIAVNFFGLIWQNTSKTMSILKFYKTIEAHKQMQNTAMNDISQMRDYLLNIYKIAEKKLLTEKKKNKLSMKEIFDINVK
ncbi:MAG: IS4 family transposase [Gammaproteobacteria bacterium]